MATAIQISNIALNNIGDGTITDFDDANSRARACKLRFEDVRDAVLRSHPWNCMTRRTELSKSADYTPPFEFDNAYVIDNTQILRVLSMYESDQYEYAFKIEGGFLLTDATTAKIKYIKRPASRDDTSDFDAQLVQAIAMALASEIAMDLTGQAQIRDLMLGKYQTVLSEARSIDSQEGTPQVIEANEWINSRNTSTSGNFRPFSSSTSAGV
jgi:hypothetical protein